MSRGGKVVRLRLSPQDCMTVIDVLDNAEIPIGRLGVSNAASIAFSLLLKEKRTKGEVPNRMGFEYLNMMNRLDLNGYTKDKQAAAEALYADALHGLDEVEVKSVMIMEKPVKPDNYEQLSDRDRMAYDFALIKYEEAVKDGQG